MTAATKHRPHIVPLAQEDPQPREAMTAETILVRVAELLYNEHQIALAVGHYATTEDMLDGRETLKPWADAMQDPIVLARWKAVASRCLRLAGNRDELAALMEGRG